MEFQKDRRWIILYASVILCLTLIPYLIGYGRQGSDWRFTGFVFGVEDGNSYIAKMLIGEAGKWFFQTPYTTYPQSGYLLFMPYLLLGKLASSPEIHGQLVVLFHLFRLVAGGFMIVATYEFISVFVDDVLLRRWGTTLATIGGGLGGLFALGLSSLWAQELPLEFYSPETFGFLSIYGLPHLAMARGLLLLGLIGLLKRKKPLCTGLLWLALGFFQPLTVAIAWSIYSGYMALRFALLTKKNNSFKDSWNLWKDDLKNLVVVIAMSSPQVIYVLLFLSQDSFFSEWTRQNIITSPPFTDYLLAYGLFLPFAIIGVIREWKKHDQMGTLLLLGWFILWLPFAYFPYNLQRRLPEGIWVVMITFSAISFVQLRWMRKREILIPITVLSLIPALLLVIGGSMTAWNQAEPLYRQTTEVEAFEFIQSHYPAGVTVLAEYNTANALPAWAAVKTPIGHGPESVHLKEILPEVENFYSGNMHLSEAIQLLSDLKISLIIWPCKTKIPPEFTSFFSNPDELVVVFQNSDFIIYQRHLLLNP